jgi:hypothetical protein
MLDCFVASAPRNDGANIIFDRRPSSPAESCERGFDLSFAREATFRSGAQAAINAGKFLRRRLVFAVRQAGIELERKVGEFVLNVGRPCLDALQNLGQLPGLHGGDLNLIAGECLQGRRAQQQSVLRRNVRNGWSITLR